MKQIKGDNLVPHKMSSLPEHQKFIYYKNICQEIIILRIFYFMFLACFWNADHYSWICDRIIIFTHKKAYRKRKYASKSVFHLQG